MVVWRRLVAVLSVLVALGACSQTHSKPHVLRFADGEDVGTLNPLLTQVEAEDYLASLTGAFLVKWDDNLRAYPELATVIPTKLNDGISKDGLSITYHLRNGLRWSDNTPLTADDVVWSYHAIMNPANDVSSRAGWDQIATVDAPNAHTVVFHMRKPYSPAIETFFSSPNSLCILPKHLLAHYPNLNHTPFNELPVGAGPFKYKQWIRSERVVMVPNPYYFRGQPKLKEIDFEIIPDTNTVFTELQTGELDLWAHVIASYGRRKELKGYTGTLSPAGMWTHIDLNVKRQALSDVVVRRALELALDRKEIIGKAMLGNGVLQEEIEPSSSPYYDPRIPIVPFSIARANALLDADGWTRGPDGIRGKGGVRLELVFAATSGSSGEDRLIEVARSNWSKIGVSLDVRHYPPSQLFAPLAESGVLAHGKWDLTIFAWIQDPMGNYDPYYGCDQSYPVGQNDIGWCDRTADAAMRALYTHYDEAQRIADDRILFTQMAKDVPQITVFFSRDGYIYDDHLTNFHPNGLTSFDNMMTVDN
jgi:peptide/nickel transport system substrate-binding protein